METMDYSFHYEEIISNMAPSMEDLKLYESFIARSAQQLKHRGLLKLQMPDDYICAVDEYFYNAKITNSRVQKAFGGQVKTIKEEIYYKFEKEIWNSCPQPCNFIRIPDIKDDKYLINTIRESIQACNGNSFTVENLMNHEGFFWANYWKFTPVVGVLSTSKENNNNSALLETMGLECSSPNLLDDGCRLSTFAFTIPWKVFTEENFDIYYHFYGAPIQWYTIKMEDRNNFIRLLKDLNICDAANCNAFFRHHMYLCSPSDLAKNGIIVNRYLQRCGEVIIFKPGEIYMGFHHGFTITQEKIIENTFIEFDNQQKITSFCSCGLANNNKEETSLKSLNKDSEVVVSNYLEVCELLVTSFVPLNFRNELLLGKDIVQMYQATTKAQLPDILNSSPNRHAASIAPCMITPSPSYEKKVSPEVKTLTNSKDIRDITSSEEYDLITKLAEISPILNCRTTWNIDLNSLDNIPCTVEQYIPAANIRTDFPGIGNVEGSKVKTASKELTNNIIKNQKRRGARKIGEILKLQRNAIKFKIDRIPVKRKINKHSTYPKERKFRLEPQPDGTLIILPCELFLSEEEVQKLEKNLVPFSSRVERVGGMNIYHCDRCDQSYNSAHHLLRHQRSVHSKTKPFCCPRCLKGFKRRDHVTQHLRRKIPCKELDFIHK
ncbi:hypothetical protein RNJ44_04266 [Nakaseomyces bracarensis]|uniref:C2H2-type domain-containing protein n=1 Tax=Nakaseomyces bracarensis TaxID=273131 RepID=A0ABR4NUF2_9SACH